MFLPYNHIPIIILNHYKLHNIHSSNKIFMQINNVIYGLPQAGRLAYEKLYNILYSNNFITSSQTPGLWKHTQRPLSLVLCVDDFGIKYTSKYDFDFLIKILKVYYPITIDWIGNNYCGFNINWTYTTPKHVDINMPNYIPHTIKKKSYISVQTTTFTFSLYSNQKIHSHPKTNQSSCLTTTQHRTNQTNTTGDWYPTILWSSNRPNHPRCTEYSIYNARDTYTIYIYKNKSIIRLCYNSSKLYTTI